MDIVFTEFFVHIFIVHAPDTIFILDQRTENYVKAIVSEAVGKADISGAVEKDFISWRRKRGKGGDHTAENTVFVADTFFCKTCNMVACFVPADDFVKIFL